MILRQFISRRGPPEEIRSDRGTHFVGEDIEMRDTIEHLESVKQRSRWSYNKRESNGHLLLSPASPYMAGIRERLVRVARKHFKAVVGDRLLNELALRTLFTEGGWIVNNRPIIPVSNEAQRT